MSGEPWQYHWFYANWKNDRWEVTFPGEPEPMRLVEALNRLGSQGWELVAVVPLWSGLSATGQRAASAPDFSFSAGVSCEQIMLFFKRRLPSKEGETAQ